MYRAYKIIMKNIYTLNVIKSTHAHIQILKVRNMLHNNVYVIYPYPDPHFALEFYISYIFVTNICFVLINDTKSLFDLKNVFVATN